MKLSRTVPSPSCPLLPAAARVLSLLFACALLLLQGAGPAHAEVREYGPAWQRFTMDIPAGWEDKKVDDSVQLVSQDGKTVMSVRLFRREGKRAEALVRKAARDLNVSGIFKKNENTWIFYVASENVRICNTLRTMNDNAVLVSVTGPMEQADHIISSLRAKAE